MSTILGALHPWIEAQVSSRLESLKTKSELVQLALKVESSSSFCPSSTSNGMPVRDIGDSIKLGKCSRNDHDGPGFPATKPRRNAPTEPEGQRDLSKIKCYNYG